VNPVGERPAAEEYQEFGERQAGDSPCFTAWALGVAGDPQVLELVQTLPRGKQQPNLVFAAARWHGARPGPYDGLRTVLLERWDRVRATVLERATQTNEVGRCATMLPLLAGLPGPLALLEVGCSAGLCLYPDRYSYRYTGAGGEVHLDPDDGPSPVLLGCEVRGRPPLPTSLPSVVWRGGIDLNPLDVHDDDAMRWLQTLVWPEHEERRARLAAAVDLARAAAPPTLVRGDLLEELPALVEQVPPEATLVVFHSAVAAYLSDADRRRLTETMADLRGHWVSNEGAGVLPHLADPAEVEVPAGSPAGVAPFLLALDGTPVAWTHGHGGALVWWDRA
jgi:hypothetical protein